MNEEEIKALGLHESACMVEHQSVTVYAGIHGLSVAVRGVLDHLQVLFGYVDYTQRYFEPIGG